MKHFFVLNPAAGKGKAIQRIIDQIHAVCKSRGVDYIVHLTDKIGEATEFVRNTCKSTTEKLRFYACGGDGTINETASGIIGHDNAELGVIPMGTGNDFVRNFENNDKFFDIEAQLDGEAERIDVLKYNDKYSVNMINIGFDCQVAKQAVKNRRNTLVPRKAAFIFGVVQKFISMPDVKARVIVDGEEQKRNEFQLCAIANGSYCGGGFRAAPISTLRDGVVDVCLISKVTRMQFLKLVGFYKAGTHLEKIKDDSIISYKKCSKLEMIFSEPTDVCVDGEIEQLSSLEISTVPQALSFSIPRGALLNLPRVEEKQPSYV